jgi:hypothetical protein
MKATYKRNPLTAHFIASRKKAFQYVTSGGSTFILGLS